MQAIKLWHSNWKLHHHRDDVITISVIHALNIPLHLYLPKVKLYNDVNIADSLFIGLLIHISSQTHSINVYILPRPRVKGQKLENEAGQSKQNKKPVAEKSRKWVSF